MKSIIINADDFGISKDVNNAIMAAMDTNLCMDTTLLVNFENSKHAVELAILNSRIKNVGIHLNLTQGFPLTNKIRKESRFCNSDGLFNYKKTKRIVRLSASEKDAVYEEISSQIQLCKSFGFPISHADSHNHIHEEPGLFRILIDILKKEKIPFLRLTNNIGKTSIVNKLYRNSYNYILNINRLAGTDYFGSLSNLYNFKNSIRENSIIELMVHPGLIRGNEIFDVYSNENLTAHLPRLIEKYKLMSYSQL